MLGAVNGGAIRAAGEDNSRISLRRFQPRDIFKATIQLHIKTKNQVPAAVTPILRVQSASVSAAERR